MRYLLLILLTGCAQLVEIDRGNPPPSDWPNLEERIIYVESPEALHRYCGKPPPSFTAPQGCTLVDFRNNICTIHLASKDPALLEHERWHCKGYPHVRSPNNYAAAWERWKKVR